MHDFVDAFSVEAATKTCRARVGSARCLLSASLPAHLVAVTEHYRAMVIAPARANVSGSNLGRQDYVKPC